MVVITAVVYCIKVAMLRWFRPVFVMLVEHDVKQGSFIDINTLSWKTDLCKQRLTLLQTDKHILISMRNSNKKK